MIASEISHRSDFAIFNKLLKTMFTAGQVGFLFVLHNRINRDHKRYPIPPSSTNNISPIHKLYFHTIKMSTTRNIDSVNPKQGEFHPSVPRSEPLTTKGVSYQSITLT